MGKDPDMSKSMFKAGVTLKSDHAFQSFAQLISEHLLKRKHYKLSGLLLRALLLWRWAIGTSHAAPRALSLFSFHHNAPGKPGHYPTCPGWVTMLRPSLPHAWEALLPWTPLTHLLLLFPASHNLLPDSYGFGTLLDLPCSYLWPPVGFKLPHKLGPPLLSIPWLRWQLTTWSPRPQYPALTIPTSHPSSQPTANPHSLRPHPCSWTKHHVWGLSNRDSSTITFNYSPGHILQTQLVLSATVSLCTGGDPVPVPKQSSCAVQPCHVLTTLYFLISTH